jgi:hypothetical protein
MAMVCYFLHSTGDSGEWLSDSAWCTPRQCTNPFNLSSDLMEPFRVLIDRETVDMDIKEFPKKKNTG